VSEGTLEKAVSDATGKTFRDFKDETLLDSLMEFFASHRTCTIKQASLAVGYKSQRSFARAVKRACGLSPQALRSRMVLRQS
jgi:AraC-like DNA-binding protein